MRFGISSMLVSSLLLFSGLAKSENKEPQVLVSIGLDTLVKLKQEFREKLLVVKKTDSLALVQVPSKELLRLSQFMHHVFGRCGGFVVENQNLQEAFDAVTESIVKQEFHTPVISHQSLVNKAMNFVDEAKILQTINTMSSHRNRLYTSPTGVRSQEWVGSKWQELASSLPNTDLQFFEHSDYPQRSVIFTVKGSEKPDEILVVGGHGDSIAGWSPSENTHAPGADDNASGIATITEAIRILGQMGLTPKRTIKFMSYAAEEVGLRGSADIAASFKERQEHVVGVMQLDMTNYSKRSNEIVLMTDYTNAQQNAFIKDLIRTYLPKMIAEEDECGYACSDHASWDRNGFPASIPFESRMNEYNHNIHTARDTLSVTQNRADHSVPYAKLLLSYIFEMAY